MISDHTYSEYNDGSPLKAPAGIVDILLKPRFLQSSTMQERNRKQFFSVFASYSSRNTRVEIWKNENESVGTRARRVECLPIISSSLKLPLFQSVKI